jgi:hypothetical protein
MKVAEKRVKKSPELNFVHLLGGKSIITRPIRSEFDIIALSNEGISKASLDALIGHLGVSKRLFLKIYLMLPLKRLSGKKVPIN